MEFASISSFAADNADNPGRYHQKQGKKEECLLSVVQHHSVPQTHCSKLLFDFQALQTYFLVCQESLSNRSCFISLSQTL